MSTFAMFIGLLALACAGVALTYWLDRREQRRNLDPMAEPHGDWPSNKWH